ncbi:uncharacterized protein LOC112045844 [Bicyclus anynana]|uniref:Uncharacterized protein LOC112045844 n=1 Tax=Bicyclus anynana TaxID=110368 RepID=A0A6J1MTV3_BICAN|nr:uncharacterized protein LOC112045844 [Bicyclus anynana]
MAYDYITKPKIYEKLNIPDDISSTVIPTNTSPSTTSTTFSSVKNTTNSFSPSALTSTRKTVTYDSDTRSKNNEKLDIPDDIPSTATPTNTGPSITATTLSSVNNPEDKLSVLFARIPTRQKVTAYCYRCGLNESRIPSALCHNSFEGKGDITSGIPRSRFKIKCIRHDAAKEENRIAYGPSYRPGCFKRYLDVGVEYNERGCRTKRPTKGKSFASKRFASMEYLLKNEDDACIASPYASLTPFSRAISLFARYHVCVCSRKYCNSAKTTGLNIAETFILLFYTLLKYIFC